MLELEEALIRILSAIKPLPVEVIPIEHAVHRVLAEAVYSPGNLPSFDNSAMDGYAVRSAEVTRARSDSPVPLRKSSQIAAGDGAPAVLQPGSCIRVFTGAPVPSGADAVVMQEDTKVEPDRPETILVFDPVKPWENVRLCGEDVKSAALLFPSGERLTARHVGLLSAVGVSRLKVHCRPTVALLATGSELVRPSEVLSPGKIYESNRLSLAPQIERAGAAAVLWPLVPDTLEATREALRAAFDQCDGVITTGGVSVGELDFVKRAFTDLGGTVDLWRIAVKPGKPFVFGRWGQKFLFGLPGNPVSALVTYLLLVRPALWRWQGLENFRPLVSHGRLAAALVNVGDRRHFMRVRIDEVGNVNSSGTQASHLLSSLALANGLVDVPPRTTLAVDEQVQVLLFED